MALAPAQTTAMGVRASSARDRPTRRTRARRPCARRRCRRWRRCGCRPRCAAIIVAATVVAPDPPRARARARSRRESFEHVLVGHAREARRRSNPTWIAPSSTAMVAGTAPFSRTTASSARPTLRLSGRGRPCAMMVDSRATTGRASARASATSGERRREAVPISHVRGCLRAPASDRQITLSLNPPSCGNAQADQPRMDGARAARASLRAVGCCRRRGGARRPRRPSRP